MSAAERFFDTNVLLYILSADASKSGRAEKELGAGGVIRVQVLNEFASVASRKLKMSLSEIREVLTAIRAVCKVVPINKETHDKGLEVAEKYGLSVDVAMIVVSALLSGCNTVLSEDMPDGQNLNGQLKVRNPFC